MSRDLLTLEEIKSYDDSYWLRYLAENTIFDTENIKAQKDWLINQLTVAKEEIARINCDYYADKQRFVVQRRKLAELEAREQKLREAIESSMELGMLEYAPYAYEHFEETLSTLYPKEGETK